MRVVDEAVGKRIVKYQREWNVALFICLELLDESFPLSADSAISRAEGVGLSHTCHGFIKHALHSGVHTAESARLEAQLKLWNLESAGVALEYVSSQVLL